MVQLSGPLSGRTRLLAASSALLLTGLVIGGPIAEAVRLENHLSEVADSYSESNALRSAQAILAHGWTANAGLPETTFGGLYPETGHWRKYGGQTHIDTHYPGGTTWLTAAMRIACGQRPVSCLRALPIAVSALGAFVLAFALMVSLGLLRGLAAAVGSFVVPLYANMMLGLHYQGYALALLSIELGLLLVLFSSGRTLQRRDLLAIAALGFVQGWLAFDYFFLVTLAPLPLAVLFSDVRAPEARRRLGALVAAAAVGFTFAHTLHFLQVVAYLGDFGTAARDLIDIAIQRAEPLGSSFPDKPPPPSWAADPWMLSQIYLFVLSTREMYFGFPLGWAFLAELLALIGLRGARLPLPGMELRLAFAASSRPAWAIISALLVSCAWISVMRGHAFSHPHFVPRHLFLVWFVMLLAPLCAFRLEPARPAASA